MTVRAEVTIECVECGNQHDEKYPAMACVARWEEAGPMLAVAVEKARSDAAAKGWRVRTGPTDLCPECLRKVS